MWIRWCIQMLLCIMKRLLCMWDLRGYDHLWCIMCIDIFPTYSYCNIYYDLCQIGFFSTVVIMCVNRILAYWLRYIFNTIYMHIDFLIYEFWCEHISYWTAYKAKQLNHLILGSTSLKHLYCVWSRDIILTSADVFLVPFTKHKICHKN